MLAFYALFALFGAINAQYFERLSDFEAEGVVNKIYNGSTSIYITASSDNIEFLKKIEFTNNGTTMSAYELTQNRYSANGDWMRPWKVVGLTTMVAKLSKADMNKVSGSIYVTTPNQANNYNFYVYDITQVQDVKIDKAAGNFTVVFLNSQYSRFPFSPTAFSNWNQPSDTSVFMYPGYPTDFQEDDKSQIFSNPVDAWDKMRFIPSVEDFSVTMDYFYIRVGGAGGLTFTTSPIYKDIDKTKTKSTVTTGFYMKSYSQQSAVQSIHPMRDTPYFGGTGVNSIAFIPTYGTIHVETYDELVSDDFTFPPSKRMAKWYTPMIGKKLNISPNNTTGGQFYIQYYIIEGENISGNSSSAATQAPGVQTSTKSVGMVRISWIIVLCSIVHVMIKL